MLICDDLLLYVIFTHNMSYLGVWLTGAKSVPGAGIVGLGPVDAVLVLDEDPEGGAEARDALSATLRSLLTVPLCARGAAPREGPDGASGGEVGAGGAAGGKVITVVRFVTEGTVEEVLERQAAACISSLEVRWFVSEVPFLHVCLSLCVYGYRVMFVFSCLWGLY